MDLLKKNWWVVFAVAAVFYYAGPARGQEAAPDSNQAQAWFDASRAYLEKPGRVVAVVLVEGKGAPVRFRYDRMAFDKGPAVERIIAPDGRFFAHVLDTNKDWVESMDWGKSGDKVDMARGDQLHVMEEMAMRGLSPPELDSRGPDPEWETVQGEDGVFKRLHRPVTPESLIQYKFTDVKLDIPGMLLRSAWWQGEWEAKPAKVTVDYFYVPPGDVSQDSPLPEEEIAAALRDARSRPVKVDVIYSASEATGDATAVRTDIVRRMRVTGIVSGRDFDLTVLKDGAFASRQIALGNEAWSSADGGKTWLKEAKAYYTYYDKALGAVQQEAPGAALVSPGSDGVPSSEEEKFFAVGYEVSDAEKSASGGGEALRRFSLVLPAERMPSRGGMDFLTYWLGTKEGKPVLRRITGSMVAGFAGRLMLAQYDEVPDGNGVVAPPGNPQAAAQERAEDLLAGAVKAMEGKGWHVVAGIALQDQTAKDTWSDPKPQGKYEGVISGRDFDLTGGMAGGEEQWIIGAGDTVWTAGKIAGIWSSQARNDNRASGDYQSAYMALESQFTGGLYDIIGKEKHDGETWLYIRKSPSDSQQAFVHDAEYWLLLDGNGHPVAVRRCLWTRTSGFVEANRVSRGLDQEDYTPAGKDEKVKAPQGEGE